MEKMKKTIATLIFCSLFLSIEALAQSTNDNESIDENSYTKSDLFRKIRLENNSKTAEILIDIKDNIQRFELWISSSINNGKLTIEVYDPDGIRQGYYSVGNQLNSEFEEEANGSIRKSLFEPQSGNWKVKIVPQEATGTIKIATANREYN
jgi:hypothetical protein